MIDLLDRYFGPEFHDTPTNLDVWDRIDRVSDEELWRTHERRRERMVAFARTRLQQQLARRGVTNSELARGADALSPYTLTISFARRFASYKRADLLLADPDRLIRLLTDKERPIQMIFAGQGAPARPGGEGDHQEACSLCKRPSRGQQDRVPRRLRHDDVALPDLGQRPVAEHARAARWKPAAPAA